MGVFQDETFADALKLALAAGMLSYMTPCAFPGQLPIFLLTPSTPCDIMNPTTTKPLTILDPYLSTPGSTKTLRPSYVAIPLYTIIPLPTIQVQGPPPRSTLSPHLLGSAFWDVVGRTLAYSVHGAAVLACVLSAVSEAASQKVRNDGPFFRSECHLIPRLQELALLRDERQLPSCDAFDLDFIPPTPADDDLLRVDIAGLESIPSSELYLGEEDLMTATPVYLVRLAHALFDC